MPPDPAGRRSPRRPARGVAAVHRAGTIYSPERNPKRRTGKAARIVLAVAGMTTGMVGGGLLLGQVVAIWLGV